MKDFGHAGRIGWRTWLRGFPAFGGDGGEATPVPIPNTAVKLSSADGTAGLPPWESRSPPNFILGPCAGNGAGAFSLTICHNPGDDGAASLCPDTINGARSS